jgi:hypothetical protein
VRDGGKDLQRISHVNWQHVWESTAFCGCFQLTMLFRDVRRFSMMPPVAFAFLLLLKNERLSTHYRIFVILLIFLKIESLHIFFDNK